MRISIIIPVYNGTNHVQLCMASIAAQQCNDVEIVCINDGSTDETLDLLQKNLPLTGMAWQLHSQPNQGTYAAMNKGISLAKGDWLFFLGIDDRLARPEVLAAVLPHLDVNKAELVYGDVQLTSNGQAYNGAYTLHRLYYESNICHQAMFYHRSVFDRIGNYNTTYRIWADWDLNIRLFAHPGMRTQYINETIAVYNDLSGISSRQDPEFRRYLPVCLLGDAEAQRRQLQETEIWQTGERWLPRLKKWRRWLFWK
jgi:glycosyltransferase involved in cell wall biosynthesis